MTRARSWSRSARRMTLFPLPGRARSPTIAREWGGKVFFDGAHQLGLIAGGQFQDPLRRGRRTS